PAGVGPGTTRAGVDQRERGQQIDRDTLRVAQVALARYEHEILPARKDLVDRGELAGQRDRLADPPGLVDDVVPVHARGARVGRDERRQDPHERGLARAVRAEERDDAPGRHVQVYPAQHAQVAERLLDASYPQRGLE